MFICCRLFAAGSLCLQLEMTRQMSSHTARVTCGFTVRTVYCCDACGLEVSDQEQIIQHVAEHHKQSINRSVRLDQIMPQQRDNVTSSSTVTQGKSSRKLKCASTERSDGQFVSESSVDSKPLLCRECGKIYKYPRCLERHIEQWHKTATLLSSRKTLSERQCRAAADALQLASEIGNASDDRPEQSEVCRDISTDDPLNDVELELQEVTNILDEVLTGELDDTQPVKDVHKSHVSPYCCAECPKRFRTRHSFRLHIADRHRGWTFICQCCGQLFLDSRELCSHTLKYHGEVPGGSVDMVEPVLSSHCCTICRFRYRSEGDLAKHMASHDDCVPAFACSMCSGRYVTESVLRRHVQRTHSGDHPYPCELCGDRFATAEERNVHVRQHDPELCTVCGVQLRRQTDSGMENGAVTCSVCYLEQLSSRDGVRIASKAAVEDTAAQCVDRTSSLLAKYCCSTCGIKFAWRSNLRQHERQHKNPVTDTADTEAQHFQCLQHCSRVFSKSSGLRQHILRHVESRQFKRPSSFYCKLCGQRFSSKKSLVRHSHNAHPPSSACHIPVVTVPPSSTDHCDSTATTISEADVVKLDSSREQDRLRSQFRSSEIRVNSHGDATKPSNGELPPGKNDRTLVPCPECGAAFFWISNVRRHVRKQHLGNVASSRGRGRSTDEGHLQCNRCGRQFARLAYLRVHLRAHENAKSGGGGGGVRSEPLLCSQCGQRQYSSRQLRLHMLRHDGVRPHRCQLCDKSFFVAAQLNVHVSVVHRGNRFVCEQCGHEANSRNALKAHCRSAHPVPGVEPPYACSVCSRRYWTRAALRRHADAHDSSRSPMRKAMCAVCGLVFRHAYNLSHHVNTAHADVDCATPFACATCGQQFNSGPAFKAHYRSKHRNR